MPIKLTENIPYFHEDGRKYARQLVVTGIVPKKPLNTFHPTGAPETSISGVIQRLRWHAYRGACGRPFTGGPQHLKYPGWIVSYPPPGAQTNVIRSPSRRFSATPRSVRHPCGEGSFFQN
jgi:hypothetical protein